MRTTVEFDEDTAKAVDALRRERGIGVSEAVNELIRRGLLRRRRSTVRAAHAAAPLKMDVSNVAEALEVVEGS